MTDATKAEPVAWQWLGTANFRVKLPKNAEKGAWVPLYTHPPESALQRLTEAGEIQAAMERIAELEAAAREVVSNMEGRMPIRGWLRDNGKSREALDRLVNALWPRTALAGKDSQHD